MGGSPMLFGMLVFPYCEGCWCEVSVCTTDMSDTVRAPVVVELTEDDIPGAAVAEPLESHAVPSLKW